MKGFIAVDGGGSKTELVLVDILGNVLLRLIVECTNPNDVTMDKSFITLKDSIKKLLKHAKKNKINAEVIFLAIAGIEFGDSKNILKEKLIKCLKFNNIHIDGDLASVKECGLSNKDDGVVIISGTGFNMSVKQNKKFTNIGGWGYLADDYFSGFDLGKEALVIASRAIDGIEEKTILVDLLEKHFDNKLWYSMKEIYDGGIKKVASLSKVVMEAYRLNDKAAIKIVDNRLERLSEVIKDKTEGMKTPVDIVLFGGIFENNSVVVDKFNKLLKDYHVFVTNKRTIYGTISLARKCFKEEIHKGFFTNLEKSYKECLK